ncbi:MAG: bifunctional 4-hydroxy-2-oxoglutarate aldolase/2-dehydro-3-deoxy-phosphogluconate aldolase [Acidobacteria bacterium]|nr:bifunctional 4-hydroxy-2-oxoglutarate aldolase/2-dehydro-3-deoxy-phosphogluconate aldolase [Acidobacteriota bacterium]
MNDHACIERIRALPIFAALTAPSADSALKSAEAAIRGGLTLIEIRLSSPGAYRVISDLRREHGDSVLVGAGEVVTSEMADRAVKSGAQFISSPHTDESILTICREKGLLAVAGALTPTEVMKGWNLGTPIVGISPAGPFGGAAYVRMLAEIYTDVRLMPSGGVSIETMRDYFRAGAFAVSVGAGLFSAGDVQSGGYGRIADRARSLIQSYRELSTDRHG